jgi:hypothetical protein
MTDFELIAAQAHIRRGMVAAYLDMGVEAFEAVRIASLWDGVIDQEEAA